MDSVELQREKNSVSQSFHSIKYRQKRSENLLAAAKFAFLPVGCATNFCAAPLTPNLTGGGGPVFCGISGAIAGCCCCCGIDGIGGTGGGDCPNRCWPPNAP